MPTEMELTLEQTQQGVSYEVSNIRVILITMKMEILLEPTSNKLMVEHAEFDESDTYVLERFYTTTGNPVKEILLKLNLPDHKSILTESKMAIELVRYGVSKGLDMVYWGFLRVGTTFDVFQNLYILYFQYGVLVFSGYGVLKKFPLWSLVSAGTDTPYLP
ncbi:hypothetical protein Tco_1547271 [Tanacetum coccineum]